MILKLLSLRLRRNSSCLDMRGKQMEQIMEEYGITIVLILVGMALVMVLRSLYLFL